MGRKSKKRRKSRKSKRKEQQQEAVPAALQQVTSESDTEKSDPPPPAALGELPPGFVLEDDLELLILPKIKRKRYLPFRLPKRSASPMVILLNAGFLVAMCGILFIHEIRTSQFQSWYFSKVAQKLSYHIEAGSSPGVPAFIGGPYDRRLGYSRIEDISQELQAKQFRISKQAHLSPYHFEQVQRGLFPIYSEKTQAGLHIVDREHRDLFLNLYPQTTFATLEEIPPVVLHTLLFIEDRELLNTAKPLRNPAVDWERLTKASLDLLKSKFISDRNVPGGSTLATQIEKFRHSPGGITYSPAEKLRQMLAATLRAYRTGRDTRAVRKQIALQYINSVPLAALAGHGEVNGLADGLWAYFGTPKEDLIELLGSNAVSEDPEVREKQGKVFRQVLSLFLAHRRPSELLRGDPVKLQMKVDQYLYLLFAKGIIDKPLYWAARKAQITVRRQLPAADSGIFVERKAQNLIRTHLSALSGIDRLYDLDRLDLLAETTLDSRLQSEVTALLLRLTDPKEIKAQGLDGRHLFARRGDLSKVIYSFTLYERDGEVNKLRIQTDSLNQPFNVNEGIKLDLGSTAKLRTLITYLEVIEEVYQKHHTLERDSLKQAAEDAQDPLSRWVIGYLERKPETTLPEILNAAMDRRYSASPGERFFTAGGLHTFNNFNGRDNGRVVSVREATRHSINLPFIRLMRDIVLYFQVHTSGSSQRALEQMEEVDRRQYLERFADKEGKIFLRRFYRKYVGKTPQEMLEVLLDGVEYKPRRFAAIYWVLHPEARYEQFADFMKQSFSERDLNEQTLLSLFNTYSNKDFSLADKGYLARVHPLELWLAAHMVQNPSAGLLDVFEASVLVRQEVYGWLFQSKRRAAQDKRIRTMLEAEAFIEIHRRWKRLGYQLDSLVPSYATALGTSADRPSALAELMGIIVNDGRRLPMMRVNRLHFGATTPFETEFAYVPDAPEQVLSPELAAIVREALGDVVKNGTALRLREGIPLEGGSLAVGGKTGTGDHRFHVYGPNGVLREARVVNRTATFVFYIGDRFFGTITVIVRGEEAEQFRFTSSLPVQLLKDIGPKLEPLLRTALPKENAAG